ncbi:MAG: hypothetical protein AABX55_02060 [Nanoarchaeota archaeon]
MASIYDIFAQLQSSGLYEFALPFLLIFAITFAVLEKTKIFGNKTNINVIVAIIFGFLMVNQFEIVDRLNLFIPKVSLFIVVAVMFLILIGIFGAKVETGFSGILLGLAVIVSLIVFYWALTSYIGLDFIGPPFLESWIYDNTGTLILLLIIVIIIYAVVSPKKTAGQSIVKDVEDWINRSLRGKP